ncbi:shikimate transporter [Luteococcus peritonei]|uniref:Shikimate transporter n=1 Tax=Luteococcus peritonei TaxID=88874 RepID=A0ABW4RSW9_9ACTN
MSTQTSQPARPTITAAQSRRAAFGGFMGAVVEWYDFLLYGLLAGMVFNTDFFPSTDPAIGVISAFAVFGVGFLFRPLGGLFFGHHGDRLGAKRMLTWTMLLAGGATVAMGFLPTYHQVGLAAPVMLVALRALQGFAIGGEWGGASLMAVSQAPAGRRAFFSSGVQIGYSVGLLMANAAVMVMSSVLSEEAFASWGWRVPFWLALPLVLLGLWVRAGVLDVHHATGTEPTAAQLAPELDTGQPLRNRRLPLLDALAENPRAFALMIAMRLGEMFSMYLVATFALSYSTNTLGWSRDFFLDVGLVVGGVGAVSIPLWAYLSDRVGRRVVYVTGACVAAALAFPFFWAMQGHRLLLTMVIAVLLVNVGHDMMVAVQQPIFTDLFGARYRYSGAGFGYQVAAVVAGGFTPFIASWLVHATGSWHSVAAYLLAGCLVSAVVGAVARHPEPQLVVSTVD